MVAYKSLLYLTSLYVNKKTLFIMRGLPGSGKSTLVNKLIKKKKN